MHFSCMFHNSQVTRLQRSATRSDGLRHACYWSNGALRLCYWNGRSGVKGGGSCLSANVSFLQWSGLLSESSASS